MSSRFDILRKKFNLKKVDNKNINNQELNTKEIDSLKKNEIDNLIDDLNLLKEYEQNRKILLENYFKNKDSISKFLDSNSKLIYSNEQKLDNLVQDIKNICVKNKDLEEKYKLDKTNIKHYEILNRIKKINNNVNDIKIFLGEMGIVPKL